MARKFVAQDIGAADVFTTPLVLDRGETASISVSGTFSATVTLQRLLDGTHWRDVTTFTAAAEKSYVVDEACSLRIGVKAGQYTSGTVTCRLGV
jgi:hypothetical protein